MSNSHIELMNPARIEILQFLQIESRFSRLEQEMNSRVDDCVKKVNISSHEISSVMRLKTVLLWSRWMKKFSSKRHR